MKKTEAEELKELRRRVAEELGGDKTDEGTLYRTIDKVLVSKSKELSLHEKEALRKRLFDSFRGMDLLQPLLDDDSITEIMVNGTQAIFLERDGMLELSDARFTDTESLYDVIQVMAASVNRIVNTSSPIADLRLANGSRVNVVLPPVAPDGPVLTVRKFYKEALTMERLIDCGTISRAAAEFLKSAVCCGANIFISGGTGSGKTTFLNALSAYIPSEERVVTIEDSLELQLQELPNLVRLEAREANLEGENRISIRDLIRTALRMRPNRIIVGEVRGEEALDMLQAMNTGHRGSLSTGHANSAVHMLLRLETMTLMAADLPLPAIRAQIASAIDLLIHLGRMPDGSRRVLSIHEMIGYEEGEIHVGTIFHYQGERGLEPTGHAPKNVEKWKESFGAIPCFTENGAFRLIPKELEAK